MTDKLTDSEIVKAWNEEIHLANYVNENYQNGIKVFLIENTRDLINRQKAEIEKLNAEVKNLTTDKENLTTELISVKTEAVTEFAERLKKKSVYSGLVNADIVYKCDIVNLLKEMVGEDNA